jgi:undecaprenyl-diphosphatase
MFRRIRHILGWIGSSGGLVLVAVLCIVGGTWGFIKLADEVLEGDTQHFDDWAVHALRQANNEPPPAKLPEQPIGPKWLQEMGRDITGLGGIAVLTILIAAVAGYLILARKFRAVVLVLASTTGALLLSLLLKRLFERPRPEVSHFSYVATSSFPSGHSMLSAAVYLTLGSLLARLVESRLIKFYFLALAICLTGLVGLSRVYMGVHFPTDVLAGWTAGLVWALLCWVIARYLQEHGAVEKPDETTQTLAEHNEQGRVTGTEEG